MNIKDMVLSWGGDVGKRTDEELISIDDLAPHEPQLHEARLERIHQRGRRITAPTHTQDAFDPSSMPAIVKWAEEHVRALNADAIVACGHSGLPIAGAVAYLTGVPLFAVRKRGEPVVACGSDDVTAFAPNGAAKRWVWLDDFISSGGTFRHALNLLWERDLIVNPWPAALLEYRVRPDWIAEASDLLRLNDDRTRITQVKYPEADWANAPKHLTEIGYDRP